MNKLFVIYDSVFGNTEKIAQAIAAAIETQASLVGMDISFPEKIDMITQWRVEFFSQMKSEFIEDIVSFEETMTEMKRRFMVNISTAQAKGEVRADLSPGLIWLAAEKLNEIAIDGSWKGAVSDYNELHRQLRTLYFHGLLAK